MYKPIWLKIVFLLGVLLTVSCGPPSSTVTDQEFEEAVQQAHDTLDVVRQAILAPTTARFIGLKVRFAGEDGAFEDHWNEPIDYYDDVFTIKILDGLTLDIGLHPGNFIEVPVKDVIDWMIVESDGKLLGGYTIKLDYEHMTPEEQKNFLQ
ncbi:MAG: DUF2314 domain-containing protein [Chloroflexi bacterium]|nr:DUF2314 domain-containing protein [Chloroflexota bacterium]